jgi:hypothetical protein
VPAGGACLYSLATDGGSRDGARLPDLAMSVNNLAVFLADAGRRAEGLAAAHEEAFDLYRELANGDEATYGPASVRADALLASLTGPEP